GVDPQRHHLFLEPLVVLAELRVRMRIGRSREPKPLLQREPKNFVRRIQFVYRLAPARGRKLDRESTRGNEIERLRDEICDRRFRPMTVDLDKIEMRQAIDQAAARYLANPPKIIGIDLVDIAPGE